MRRYSNRLQWKNHWEITWLRYPLWIWLAFSALCWLTLDQSTQILITPYVCAALLLGIALLLNWGRIAISTHPLASGVKRELRDLLVAVCATAAIGLAFPWLFGHMTGDSPTIVGSAIAWALCSAGFALSLLVTKLLMSFVRHIGEPPTLP